MSTTTPVATKIMLIRHAEKPSGSLNGVNESGDSDSSSLIPQGWQRAGALIPLFEASFGPIPVPATLFAPNVFGKGTSRRPFETITPLAAKLGITINASVDGKSVTQYASTDYPAMVTDAISRTGVVLIAWEHEDVPSIANQILGNKTVAPQKWPGSRFDVIWTFDLNSSAKSYSFNQLPQLLLQSDLPTPIF
jgi:broad specificity phosphatase PhoE